MAATSGRRVAFDGRDHGACKLGAEGLVVGAGEVGAQVFAGLARREIRAQQALDGLGAVFGGGAEADLARDARVLADRAADAEVEGIDHLAVLLDLLAFEADVGDPALSAGVGAAGDVQVDLLVEGRQAVFHLAGQPLGEGLGLGDGQLAELRPGACDRAAPEGRDLDLQADLAEAMHHVAGARVWNIGDENVLHDGGAQVAVAELFGEVGELDKLVAG